MSLSVSARNAYKASDAGVVVHPEGWRTRERENPRPRIAPIPFAVPCPLTTKKHRRRIPLGTIRPSIASPRALAQRLSLGRSVGHRSLTNSPLGNFRQLRQIPLTFVPTRGRTIWSTDINPLPRQIRTPTPIDEKPSFPSFPHVGPLYENGPPV